MPILPASLTFERRTRKAMSTQVTVIEPPRTTEQAEIMQTIANTVKQVDDDGYGTCKLCGKRLHGDFGDVLQQLGEHGDVVHSNRK